MERLIIKESHIFPPNNQKIGKHLIILYVVNIVSKDLQSDLVRILITSTIFSMHMYVCMYIYIIHYFT
jgi:hypothetical protein